MTLQMFTDGDEYVIAYTAEEACVVVAKLRDEPDSKVEMRACDPSSQLKFDHQDARGVETKTVAEWIAEQGRGYFAGPI